LKLCATLSQTPFPLFSCRNFLTPFLSQSSALFCKNTGGWVTARVHILPAGATSLRSVEWLSIIPSARIASLQSSALARTETRLGL
jgi:hypothetical protein